MTTENTKKTNFVGNGKSFGTKIQITLNWEDLKKLEKNEFKGKKYITLDVLPLRATNQFGKTHTVIEHEKNVPKEQEALQL